MVYPLPAVLVSCGVSREEYNLITVAWTGTVCTEPPMCYISMRKDRHSYGIISRTRECVINLTTEALARATDWCGVNSGRDHFELERLNVSDVGALRRRFRGEVEYVTALVDELLAVNTMFRK